MCPRLTVGGFFFFFFLCVCVCVCGRNFRVDLQELIASFSGTNAYRLSTFGGGREFDDVLAALFLISIFLLVHVFLFLLEHLVAHCGLGDSSVTSSRSWRNIRSSFQRESWWVSLRVRSFRAHHVSLSLVSEGGGCGMCRKWKRSVRWKLNARMWSTFLCCRDGA